MPLGSSSEAPVMRPGPMISASFGRSGCLIWSDEGRIFISKISAGLPEQLAIKQEEAANVPICGRSYSYEGASITVPEKARR
jgi:hypothetical protein